MKQNNDGCEPNVSVTTSSSRDAVETAIDITKDNRLTTWEESAKVSSQRIARWGGTSSDREC